jgi:acid phosphatase family membrane protein YuiD
VLPLLHATTAAAAAVQVVAVRCWRVVRADSISLEVTNMQVGGVPSAAAAVAAAAAALALR